jgi:peptidase E
LPRIVRWPIRQAMTGVPRGQIVALGGGGFSSEPDNALLDDFILSRAKRAPARVCFIPTASGDSVAYVARFYRALSGRCIASDLTLNDSRIFPRRPKSTRDLAAFVAEQDVLYVGGGSTFNLLALWRAHGLDELLREAWMSGAVLAGVSAGMNCWFQASITDSFGALTVLRDGLGFVEGSACPDYSGESGRRSVLHEAVKEGLASAYAADEGAALHFAGQDFSEAISSRRDANAYRVFMRDGQLVEERMRTRFLGDASDEATQGS